MSQTTLQLEKLTCPSCMQKITNTLNNLRGVENTKFLFDRNKVSVFYDGALILEESIIREIIGIGYNAKKMNERN